MSREDPNFVGHRPGASSSSLQLHRVRGVDATMDRVVTLVMRKLGEGGRERERRAIIKLIEFRLL